MPIIDAVLMQKTTSPFQADLELTLTREVGGRLWLCPGPPLPPVDLGAEGLVIWDLTDFSAPEVESLCQVMAAGQVGVVVASGAVDELTRRALALCQALGLLALPAPPPALAAALEAAMTTHRRIFALEQERESLLRQLAEREVIERAKRVLMAATGVSETEAMRQMQKHARDNNLKLMAVAQKLLETYKVFNGHDHKEGGES
jgi:AmiR/NasT family two-component response regulator